MEALSKLLCLIFESPFILLLLIILVYVLVSLMRDNSKAKDGDDNEQ